MAEDRLTKDDLVLLMESYRNMITMHQTILDQTNKTIDKLDHIATKQDSLFSKQGNVCMDLGQIKGKLDDNADLIKDSVEKISSHEKKSIEDHSKITNKIYIGWVGMITIIVTLIGLGMTVASLFNNVTP